MERLSSNYAVTFITGTKFYGRCNELGMQDYGLYIYPDGTKYLGQFVNNHFHGNGTIEIPSPFGMCFSVVHRHGKLLHLARMSFNDRLPVDFKLTDDTISFDKWKYCTKEDRRFNAERLEPMRAVGPLKHQTRDGPCPPPLKSNAFDIGFGTLNDKGFLLQMPEHMTDTPDFYLGCRDVRRWVHENCRHGPLKGKHLKQEVLSRFARQIMRNNLDSAKELKNHPIQSLAKNSRHKAQACRRSRSAESSSSTKAVRLHLGSTSISCTSIMDYTVKHDLPYKRITKSEYPIRRSKTENNVCRLN